MNSNEKLHSLLQEYRNTAVPLAIKTYKELLILHKMTKSLNAIIYADSGLLRSRAQKIDPEMHELRQLLEDIQELIGKISYNSSYW